jgi:hypothetical protein
MLNLRYNKQSPSTALHVDKGVIGSRGERGSFRYTKGKPRSFFLLEPT